MHYLVQRIKSDVDLLSLHQDDSSVYPFLLETALTSSGRHFDILFAFPKQTLLLDNEQLIFTANSEKHYSTGVDGLHTQFQVNGQDFLHNFDQWWHKEKQFFPDAESLPFRGGWFVYLGYELAGQIETSLQLPLGMQSEPVAFATRIPAALIRNHSDGYLYAVSESGQQKLIDAMLADLKRVQSTHINEAQLVGIMANVAEEDPERYISGVQRIRDYIKNGDVFQVNLSRWWNIHYDGIPAYTALYRRLRRNNPSPFFGLAKFGDSVIISSSPERLVAVNRRQVSTRPIAGTRPRGDKQQDDLNLRDELIAHPKERAEHIMLVDLERNDLGRVCEPGSIKVDELMALEAYSHVHHIVSNIIGRLRATVTPGEVLRAMFPGGTITGCPKVRCMEIIAELEQSARGAYTGSMGYINRDGDMDFNILIRTMVQRGSQVHFRTGAGIVADSVAEKELAETRAKAKGLLRTLGVDS